MNDFAAADPHSRNLRFTSWGSADAYGLQHRLDGPEGELERRVLGRPVSEVAPANEDYAELLRGIVERHRVDHIYVSSFIGHSLDVLRTGLPTTVVHHDYFPFCPALARYAAQVRPLCPPPTTIASQEAPISPSCAGG